MLLSVCLDEVFDELRVIEINEAGVLLVEGRDGLHVSVREAEIKDIEVLRRCWTPTLW